VSIPLGRFDFFQKFAEIFAAQGAPPVLMTPVSLTAVANLTLPPVANL